MTYKELKEIFTKNNVPEDVTLLSDSGWECDATNMDGIYYNRDLNIVVFTQYTNKFDHYFNKNGWVIISNK